MTSTSEPAASLSSRIDHPPIATTGEGLPLPAPPHRALLLLLLALSAGLGLTQWLNHQTVSRIQVGYLRAERNVIVSPAEGIVQEVRQQPGTIVEPGTVVVLLADARLERQIAARRRTLTTLQAAQAQARAKANVELALRLRDLEREEFEVRTLSATHLEKQFFNEFVRTASEDLIQRSDGVASNGSDDQTYRLGALSQLLTGDKARIQAIMRQQAARNAATINASQVQLCRKQITRIEQLRKILPNQVRQATGVDVAEEQLRDARETLAELERIRERLTLRANAYGTVGLYLKQTGDTVSVGDEIVELYDRERQHIDLPVPSRLINRYPIGTLVTLRFSGPIKCRGRVANVPPHTEQNVATLPGNDPLVRVLVEPIGRLWPEVPIGSSVEVEVE